MRPPSIRLIILTLLGISILLLAGCPMYSVWRNGKHGEAELKRATYNRQIITQEALAKREAAEYLAQADTVRAHGVARSNEIIGKSLENNHAYLYWLWINGLENTKNQVIYVNTERNMPIMEAGRFGQMKTLKDSDTLPTGKAQ